MERRELKYLLNHQQEMLTIDVDYAKKNNCSEEFIEILRKQRFLEKEEIFNFLSYINGIIDILKIYENKLMKGI